MANVCDNRFYLSIEENFEEWNSKFINFLNDHFSYYDITYSDYFGESGGYIEGYFESRWVFPDELFKKLFINDNNIYFRCLSEEYGCSYVAMNIYSNSEWKDEQTFNLH